MKEAETRAMLSLGWYPGGGYRQIHEIIGKYWLIIRATGRMKISLWCSCDVVAWWQGLSGDTAFRPRPACQGKPDLQRPEGRGDQAMRKSPGQGRSTHSQEQRGKGNTQRRRKVMGTCLRGLRKKMMKSDSVLKRSRCLVCRKLTVMEARMGWGNLDWRLQKAPRQKMSAPWTKVWVMEEEGE